MVDILTLIFIGIVVYKIFARKDRAPQRRPARPEDYRRPARTGDYRQPVRPAQPARPVAETRKTAPPKESIFESIERQIRESAENLERELRGGSEEGYSDYGKYPSSQGSQGVEGTAGDEGTAGTEGTAGVEGSWGREGRAGGESDFSGRKSKSAKKKSPSPEPELRQPAIKEQEPEPGTVPALSFSSQEIVKGIIWAEILKKPQERTILSRRF